MKTNRGAAAINSMRGISVRDVADFHLHWREFRPDMCALAEGRKLNARQREIMSWLIRLADRIGTGDIR
jgi:hypothetical protein